MLLEKGDNPEKGEGLMKNWGGCHFFITLMFNFIYCVCACLRECVCVCVCGVKFPLLHFGSSAF